VSVAYLGEEGVDVVGVLGVAVELGPTHHLKFENSKIRKRGKSQIQTVDWQGVRSV
jgi:hypothetical protein